jgi:elongation factor 2
VTVFNGVIMAKDRTEEITELMSQTNQIRNIAIAAHIDHGKCVSGDTKVSLRRGSETAKEIFERYSSIGKPTECCDNDEVFDISDNNLMVSTFDTNTGKILFSKITHIWKLRKTDPLVKIKLKNGLEVKSTPEHKFLVRNNSSVVEKRADELTMQDIIICPREIKYDEMSLDELKSIIIDTLSKNENFYVFLHKQIAKELHKKIINAGREKVWKHTNSRLKMLSFYHGAWRGVFRLNDLLKVYEFFGMEKSRAYDSVKHINYRGVAQRGVHSSINLRLPESERDFRAFFYLVGVMFGDGNTEGNIDNTDEEIHRKIIEICKSVFGIDATVKRYSDRCPRIIIGNKTFKQILSSAFNFPLKKKSLNIRVPKIMERIPLAMCGSFLRGYFDTDGSVEKGRSAVSLSSASPGMAQDIQMLLLRFGCPSQFYEKKSCVYISGTNSLNAFKNHIGFMLSYKSKRLDKLSNKAHSSRIMTFSASSMQLQAVLDVYFAQIAEISRVDSEDFVYDFTVEKTHNFVANGMIIHNTTLTDNLVAGAGMISEQLAGQQLFTDFDKQEQERGITIFAANVSMIHEVEGHNYLVNLIDTPGHVDFGGDVTRAMRAVDGAIILADAVEGVMPQTETVVRQALHERVKPVLFINKTDRLIRELKLTPEKMQERFINIINNVNRLIQKYAEKEFAEKWLVSVENGSVAFGSAYRKWAISIPYMKKHGISFKDIIEATNNGNDEELSKRAPLHRIVLNMVVNHLPNPAQAQGYRIPKIWHGDMESEIGKSMTMMNKDGPLAIIITKVVPDPHAGIVATGRIFSGTIKKGQEAMLVGQRVTRRVQQVSIYRGPQRIQMDEIPAGNIVGIVGLNDAFSGETICDVDRVIDPFEAIKHMFEPVVTKSVECKDPKDLPKLITFLRQVSREDPTLNVKIDEETGEYLVSGLGELHIDAKIERPLKEKGIEVTASPPIVIYRETVRGVSPVVEGKSSNKHNRFYMFVEPLEQGVYDAIAAGKIEEKNVKKYIKELVPKLIDGGMSRDEAKSLEELHSRNALIDATKGIQYLNETMELIIDSFDRVMDSGPLCGEPCAAIKVKITDAKLHEDAIHRGPAQVMPAINDALKEAIYKGKPTLLEPIQTIRLDMPEDVMGDAMNLVQNRRGQIIDVKTELGAAIVQAKLPVAEMFGFEAQLKSATGGKGFYSLVDVSFERIPEDLKMQVVQRIRERKGLSKDLPPM